MTGNAVSPAPGPDVTPDPATPDPATPGRPPLPTRLRRRFAALSTSNKIAVLGLLLAAAPLIVSALTSTYTAVTAVTADDPPAMAMDITQVNDSCSSSYVPPPAHDDLRGKIRDADEETLTRWERDAKITHLSEVAVDLSFQGNGPKAVQVRDVSFTVLRREKPLSGRIAPHPACGGPGPDILVVDLDTLPLHRPVSGKYLLTSPHQRAARKETARHNGKEMRLPQTVTTQELYDLMLIGRTQRHYCEWRATLTWWDGRRVHKTTIDNAGRPFRVTAAPR